MKTTTSFIAMVILGCTAPAAGSALRSATSAESSGMRNLGAKEICDEAMPSPAMIPVAADTEFARLSKGYSNCNGAPRGSNLVKNMFYATQDSLKMRTIQPGTEEELFEQVCGQQLKFDLTCQETPYGEHTGAPACVKVDIVCKEKNKEEEECYETKPDEVVLGKPVSGEKKLAKVPGFENCNIFNVVNSNEQAVENFFYFRDNEIWMRTLQLENEDIIRKEVCGKKMKFQASCQSTPEGKNINDPDVCFKMEVACSEYKY
jgi:hypothetical protein